MKSEPGRPTKNQEKDKAAFLFASTTDKEGPVTTGIKQTSIPMEDQLDKLLERADSLELYVNFQIHSI